MTAIRHDDGVIACEYIRCPAEADVWAWDGARWRRFCGRHNAALVSTLDVGLYRSSWDHPLDGDPPPPPVAPPVPDAAPAPVSTLPCHASEPEPASPPPCEVPDALTLAPPAASRLTGGAEASSAIDAPSSTPEPPCPPSSPSSPSPAGEPDSSAPAPASPSSGSASATPSRRYRDRIVPPLVLRPDADAHPELCRVAGCERPPTTRGLCRSDAERARDAGTIDALGLPPLSPAASARLRRLVAGRGRPKSSSPSPSEPPMSPPLEPAPQLRVTKTCKVAGCTDRVTAHNCCNVHYSRAKACGLNPATATGAEIVEAWTARRAEIEARRDPEAEHPLQVIRGLLGCDPDGSDAEVVEAVRRLVERDATDAGLAEALDALPCSRVPDCDTPADRIRYATLAWLAEREAAAHLARLCQEAHEALDGIGAPSPGTPAERIRSGESFLRSGLRDLLGHRATSTSIELLDAAREVKAERDRADAEIAALGELLTERGSITDDAPLLERVRAVLDQRNAAQADPAGDAAERLRRRRLFLEALAPTGIEAPKGDPDGMVVGMARILVARLQGAEGLNDALTEKIAHLKVALDMPDRSAEVEVLGEAVARLKAAPPPTAGGLSPTELACARHLLDDLHDAATSGGQVPMSGFVVLALRALVLREVSRG